MSVKRTATTELNHDNWDQEDPSEHEEMGTFKAATKDVLEKRVIRTAKRRNQVSGEEPKKSVFSGFGGFNKTQPSSFDFLANLTNGNKNINGETKNDTAVSSSLFTNKPATSPSGGGLFGIPPAGTAKPAFGATPQTSPFSSTATKTEIPTMTFHSSKADSTVGDSPFKIQSVSSSADSNVKSSTAQVSSTIFGVSSTSASQNKQPVSSTSTSVQNSATTAKQASSIKTESSIDKETEIEKTRNKYYSKLKGLNESVSSWIVKHVEKTPLCFLTPIFKDYENYLKEIQEEYEAAKAEIEAKTKKQETKPIIGLKDAKDTNQSTDTNSTATNTGLFGKTSSTGMPQSSPSKSTTSLFGTTTSPTTNQSSFATKVETTTSSNQPSSGFSFGIKPATATTDSNVPVSSPSKGFSFGITSTPSSTNTNSSSAFATTNTNISSPPSKGFSFGVTSTSAATPPKASSLFSTQATTGSSPSQGFSFGVTSTTAATSPTTSLTNSAIGAAPFSFGIGSGKPFSFSSQAPQSTENPSNQEEEDQPPKVEYTPVVEENSVFDKKCKVFVKKEGSYADKGVGTLYIKKVEGSAKHQLLVRANTNLGNVLLNLILTSTVPTQRMGKNDVMLVCIPTPDAKPPPTPVLIRVKTGQEADELLEMLNKYKS